jgi:hypothetical protein
VFEIGQLVEVIDGPSMSGSVLDIKQVGSLTQVGVSTKYGRWLFKEQELSAIGKPKKTKIKDEGIDGWLNSVDVIIQCSLLDLGDISEYTNLNKGQKVMMARRKLRQLHKTNPELIPINKVEENDE